jgi:hypothetical protein
MPIFQLSLPGLSAYSLASLRMLLAQMEKKHFFNKHSAGDEGKSLTLHFLSETIVILGTHVYM